MKSKIFKIMGVTLALVLTFTVGAAFMPAKTVDVAEAADLSWTNITQPTAIGNVLVDDDLDLGPVMMSPNFATDNTIFAIVNDPTGVLNPNVYASTNGGHTWVASVSALGNTGDYGIAVVVSPNYATDSTVFMVTQTPAGGIATGRVYRSTNGGISFGQLGVVTLGANEVITSFDVSPDYDGTGVLVLGIAHAYSGSVPATAASCVQVWGENAILSWQNYGGTAYDISAVKFSPNYAIDTTILVVASAVQAVPMLRDIVGGTWDQIAAAGVNVGATVVSDFCRTARATTGLIAADIALPQDYNGAVATLQRAYVAIASEDGATLLGTSGNVYRITGTTQGTAIATSLLNTAGIQLSNLDYNGTFAEGTLIGGVLSDTLLTQCDVYRTTNPTDSVVNWYGVAGVENQPSGVTDSLVGSSSTDNTTTYVYMSKDYATDSTVIVGTIGDESAFGISTDGAVSFNETGLIDNGNGPLTLDIHTGLAMSTAYDSDGLLYWITEDDAAVGNGMVWMHDGTYWTRCFYTTLFAVAGTGVITPSQEFATDQSLYVGDVGGTDIWYSANAGKTWSRRTCAIAIRTIGAPDATTVYVGGNAAATVAKSTNSAWTWPAALQSGTSAAAPLVDLKVKGSTVLVGGSAGSVRRSDDGGTTWSLVGGGVLPGGAAVYMDWDDSYVWAGETAGGAAAAHLYRSDNGGAWYALTEPTDAVVNAYSLDAVNAVVLADDGTLYVGDPTVAVTAAAAVAGLAPVFRSIEPEATEPTPGTTFEAIPGITAGAVGSSNLANQGSLSVVTGGSNTIGIIDITNDRVSVYTDTMSKASPQIPELVSPASGTVLSGTTAIINAYFVVSYVPQVTRVEIWYASNAAFDNAVIQNYITAPDTMAVINLVAYEGLTIHWKARASLPFQSGWSDVRTVEVPVVTPVQSPTPVSPGSSAGSTVDVAISPVLNWSAYKFASAYEMQLAKDADMSDFIADLTGANALGNVTSWKCTTTLAYNTTYFWRVRAILGTAANYSDWSNIVGFTTMAKPVAPTPPVIIEPTPPAPAPVEPTTPAYIWGIIAIGAVLVIVVIVLIVRTRRTV